LGKGWQCNTAFKTISYTYVPTAPSPERKIARGKATSKQASILDKNQSTELKGAAIDTPNESAK
jgi:hypothetical protein